MTMTPNIISIEPPGGWGGGGALPFAMMSGQRTGGMKVGFVSSPVAVHFGVKLARVSNGTAGVAEPCVAESRWTLTGHGNTQSLYQCPTGQCA